MYASIELCEQLYKLSGWGNETNSLDWWYGIELRKIWPKYDLGYMQRKLRDYLNAEADDQEVFNVFLDSEPENAAAMLCIELFERGIFKPEPAQSQEGVK